MPNENRNDSKEERDDAKGIVICSPQFHDEIEDFSKRFDHPAPLREAARFAMAIGIEKDIRIKREEWPKKGKVRTIAHLYGQFDDAGKFDLEILFDTLGLIDSSVPLHQLISEYISGGMQWIKDNELKEGTNFSQLKLEFPHLFSGEGHG